MIIETQHIAVRRLIYLQCIEEEIRRRLLSRYVLCILKSTLVISFWLSLHPKAAQIGHNFFGPSASAHRAKHLG